jgi:hypothetical protein
MGIGNLFAETLTIQVENAGPGKGDLMAGIFKEEKTFPDEYYQGQKMPASTRL